jgi:methyl acetate hydrolase
VSDSGVVDRGSNAIVDLNVPMVRSNNPALALEVETFPGKIKKWGLTFLTNTEDIEGFRSAGSLTWGGVHNTYFWIDLGGCFCLASF